MGLAPCTLIPNYKGTQILDGNGNDFCSYPGVELSFANAARIVEYNGNYGASSYPERAIARFTWTDHHLRAFIRVYDKDIVGASSLDDVWNADGVEIMITTNTAVTGSTANDTSALHIIVSPPGAGLLKSGIGALVTTSGTTGVHTALPAAQFATKRDAEGYNVELGVNWPENVSVTYGTQVYFDFALNVADSITGSNPRDAQAIFHVGTAPASSPCGDDVLPFCDDRVWCQTLFN
jgi:hypothetical protein